jgi:hypothetical protein
MRALVHEKQKALELRRKGYSYKEIMSEVSVAKSSLSLWLKDTPLTESEKSVLKKRLNANISRGRIKAAAAHQVNRLDRENKRLPEVKSIFDRHKDETLFQLGIGLYWAEGAKSSGTVIFTNSDEKMVNIVIQWIEKYTSYSRFNLRYRLYVHKPYAHENCEQWWSNKLNVPLATFTKTSYKPTSKGVKIRQNYKGCIRIEVPKSSILLHTLKVWTELLVEYHQK